MLALLPMLQCLELTLDMCELVVAAILQIDELVARVLHAAQELVQFEVECTRVPIFRVLDQNTIGNVTIVVPVLITSRQLSE